MVEHCFIIYKPKSSRGKYALGYQGISYWQTSQGIDDHMADFEDKVEKVVDIEGVDTSYITIHILSTKSQDIESVFEEDYYFDDLVFYSSFEDFVDVITFDIEC